MAVARVEASGGFFGIFSLMWRLPFSKFSQTPSWILEVELSTNRKGNERKVGRRGEKGRK